MILNLGFVKNISFIKNMLFFAITTMKYLFFVLHPARHAWLILF